MDSTSTCNAKLMERGTCRKFNKQPKSILFKVSRYKKQENIFC